MNIKKKIPFFIILFAVLLIFAQFFLKNLYIFPGDYLISWYEPWKTDHFINGVINLSHKPIADDTFRLIYPFRILSVDIFKQFQFPLWNPYNSSGTPLLAAINAGSADPLNIFFFFFPPYLAGTIIIMLQSLLIGLSTYVYAKCIKLSTYSSIFASFVYLLSASIVARMPLMVYSIGVGLIPFILFLLEKYKEKNYKKILLIFLTPTVSFLILSTHPQYVLYVFIFIFFYWFLRNRNAFFEKKVIRIFLLPAGFIFLGIGLTSFQLIPSLELYKYSNLNQQSSTVIINGFLLPIRHYISFLISNFFGNPSTYNYWGYADYVETATGVGIIPLFFAFFAFNCVKNKNKLFFIKFFTAFVVITFFLTFNSPISKFIYNFHFFFLSIGVPTRVFFISAFSLSILSAIGFDHWQRMQKLEKNSFLFLAFFWLCILILLFIVFKFIDFNHLCKLHSMKNCQITSFRNTIIEIVSFTLVSFLFTFYLLPVRLIKKIRQIFPIGILLIVYLVGLYNSYKFLPFSSKTTFFPQNDLLKEIQTKTLDGRVFGIGTINISTDFATYFHFYDPQYFHPFYLKRYAELVDFSNNGKLSTSQQRSDINILRDATLSAQQVFRRDRLFVLLSVKYLIYKKSEISLSNKDDIFWENNNFYIKENLAVLPHAYLASSVKVSKNDSNELNLLFSNNFNPKTTAIVESPIPGFADNNVSIGKVTSENYKANSLQITVDSQAKNFLVITDNYFPGWEAFIDEKKTTLYRTNYASRGVLVPEGKHIISFVYRPFSFILGLIISCGSLFMYLSIISFVYIKNHLCY